MGKRMSAVTVILFVTIFCHIFARQSCRERRSLHGFALVDHVYKSFAADRLAECFIACNAQSSCQSLNYDLVDKTCQFNNNTKYHRAKYLVEKPTSVYADNPDSEFWLKLNTDPVCLRTKNDGFGRFRVKVIGFAEAVKLVHVSGSVSCASGKWSKWGCGPGDPFRTLVTTSTNLILLPESKELTYRISGYDVNSKKIIFRKFSNPLRLSSGQELRLWYSSDLFNHSEHDNKGKSCADVYAKYITS